MVTKNHQRDKVVFPCILLALYEVLRTVSKGTDAPQFKVKLRRPLELLEPTAIYRRREGAMRDAVPPKQPSFLLVLAEGIAKLG